MKKYAFNEITTMQFIFIISGIAISFGFIEIPQVLYKGAGNSGWITLILGSLTTTAANLVIVQVMKKMPDGTILDLLAKYAGKWVGRAAAIVLSAYFLYFAYIGIVYSTRVIKARILQETPAYMTLIMLLIPAYVVARGGIRIVGRYAEVSMGLSLWIPLVFMVVWGHTHWLYLLPVLPEGWRPVLTAVPDTFFYFLGFGATAFLYPFLKNKEKAVLGVWCSQLITLFAYLYITLLSFAFFSPGELPKINQLSIYMLKAVELPFLEQVEGLFIVLYLFIFSMSWIPIYLLSSFCMSWMAGRADHRFFLRILLAGTAVFSYFYVPSFNVTYEMGEWLAKFGMAIEYAAPVLLLGYLLLYDAIRKRRRLP
ncbi:GerAB/ArcD/ProY family transporter [Cohnella hashimotonis]|uniref:Endospore germination permease n=1 Tax=Cohnella hashimotonis TaxID=2826895 RepID=A0ABT6TRS6_9BACL|nr:endospore germination permease [Cohnella hashimotonis]MDI4649533.1 endospore germination permease [Cohnella hashimotonis]